MQYIEEHAAEFGIQPEQYAIVGYSMGGHLTGLFGTESVGYKHYNVPKPAALLLGYPINDMTYIKPIYHVIQDIGAYGPKYYTRNLSDEITPDYPATYHWHGVNDTLLKELVYWRQDRSWKLPCRPITSSMFTGCSTMHLTSAASAQEQMPRTGWWKPLLSGKSSAPERKDETG